MAMAATAPVRAKSSGEELLGGAGAGVSRLVGVGAGTDEELSVDGALVIESSLSGRDAEPGTVTSSPTDDDSPDDEAEDCVVFVFLVVGVGVGVGEDDDDEEEEEEDVAFGDAVGAVVVPSAAAQAVGNRSTSDDLIATPLKVHSVGTAAVISWRSAVQLGFEHTFRRTVPDGRESVAGE
jgi:hypothetical protein